MVRSVQNGHRPFSFRWCLFCIVLAFSQISSVVYAQGGVESSEFLEKQRVQKGFGLDLHSIKALFS